MNMLNALARLLIFPGLLLAVPAAWFVLWLERKSVAVMQRRIGPPFGQPAFDFIKLLGKATPRRAGLGGTDWPAFSAGQARQKKSETAPVVGGERRIEAPRRSLRGPITATRSRVAARPAVATAASGNRNQPAW